MHLRLLLASFLLAVVSGGCSGPPEAEEYRWEYETDGGVVLLASEGDPGEPVAAGTPLLTDVSLDGELAEGSPVEVFWTDGSPPEPAFFVDAITLAQCFQIDEAVARLGEELTAGTGSEAQRIIALATIQALEDWGAESGC